MCLFLPPGAYFWLLFLPAWVLFLVLQVNLEDPSLANFPPPLPSLEAFWDAQALGFVILWILFQALLYVLPVGKVSQTDAQKCIHQLISVVTHQHSLFPLVFYIAVCNIISAVFH